MADDVQRARILRGLFDCYYADNPAEVIFYTNRARTAKMLEVLRLFPKAKFICCVSDVAWAMDSMERQFRSKTIENTGFFSAPAERSTVYIGGRELRGATCDGPVGNTVDVENASWTNDIGQAILAGFWEDPDYDPTQSAFYYVRVPAIPTPRWTTYDAKVFGTDIPQEAPRAIQERAYTSPIWYTPKG